MLRGENEALAAACAGHARGVDFQHFPFGSVLVHEFPDRAGLGRHPNGYLALSHNEANDSKPCAAVRLGEMMTVELAVRLPFDWATMLRYLEPRATPGVEAVIDGQYWRSIRINGARGYVAVGPPSTGALRVHLSPSLSAYQEPVLAKLRLLFDADTDTRRIGRALSADPTLAPLVRRRPGLRVAGAIDRFELALRAVLGQQVSVRGASTLSGRLAVLAGEPLGNAPAGLTHLSVTAERLASMRTSEIAQVGLTRARAATTVALARAVVGGVLADGVDPEAQIAQLREISGIGEWTASYIAMRALHWADAFPHADLGLRKAAGGLTARQLLVAAERWRPWRAYAAMHLWASLHT